VHGPRKRIQSASCPARRADGPANSRGWPCCTAQCPCQSSVPLRLSRRRGRARLPLRSSSPFLEVPVPWPTPLAHALAQHDPTSRAGHSSSTPPARSDSTHRDDTSAPASPAAPSWPSRQLLLRSSTSPKPSCRHTSVGALSEPRARTPRPPSTSRIQDVSSDSSPDRVPARVPGSTAYFSYGPSPRPSPRQVSGLVVPLRCRSASSLQSGEW